MWPRVASLLNHLASPSGPLSGKTKRGARHSAFSDRFEEAEAYSVRSAEGQPVVSLRFAIAFVRPPRHIFSFVYVLFSQAIGHVPGMLLVRGIGLDSFDHIFNTCVHPGQQCAAQFNTLCAAHFENLLIPMSSKSRTRFPVELCKQLARLISLPRAGIWKHNVPNFSRTQTSDKLACGFVLGVG